MGKIWVKLGLEDQNFAKQEIKPKTQNTPRLAPNTNLAHVGAHRAYQSVVLSVHMAKIRHSGRMSGQKTARKRPKRGQKPKIDPNRKLSRKLKTHPGWPEMPLLLI